VGLDSGFSRLEVNKSAGRLGGWVRQTRAGTFSALLILLLVTWLGAVEKKQGEGAALIGRAREISDIQAEGSPPFHLRAKVQLREVQGGGLKEGIYFIQWAAKRRLRSEISFDRFDQVAGRQEERSWRNRNMVYQPWRIHQVMEAFNFQSVLKLRPGEEVKSVEERAIGNATVDCVELTEKQHRSRKMCIDASSSVLRQYDDSLIVCEYQDYSNFNGKMFPGLIRVFESGRLIIEINLRELAVDPEFRPSVFVAPSGSEEWVSCEHPQAPKPIEIPSPPFPESARRTRTSGVVVLFVEIGVDGRVRDPDVVRSPSPELTASAVNTIVNRWRLQPATCGDVPVPSAQLVELSFKLH
jgi:hypothetical protein